MTDAALKEKIRSLLKSGLKTEALPRADTDEDIQAVVARLRAAGDNVEEKLKIAGFTLQAVRHGGFDQPCKTCMYYLVHKGWCDLPEIDLPVDGQWSCRLWRI